MLEAKAENTLDFHWYATKEAGLFGSQELFLGYVNKGKDVKAMLERDITGFL